MKTKIGRGLLALLVCVQALAAPNAQAQRGADRLFSLPRFERAVACIKHYEGLHGRKTTLMSATVTVCCPVSGFRVR